MSYGSPKKSPQPCSEKNQEPGTSPRHFIRLVAGKGLCAKGKRARAADAVWPTPCTRGRLRLPVDQGQFQADTRPVGASAEVTAAGLRAGADTPFTACLLGPLGVFYGATIWKLPYCGKCQTYTRPELRFAFKHSDVERLNNELSPGSTVLSHGTSVSPCPVLPPVDYWGGGSRCKNRTPIS